MGEKHKNCYISNNSNNRKTDATPWKCGVLHVWKNPNPNLVELCESVQSFAALSQKAKSAEKCISGTLAQYTYTWFYLIMAGYVSRYGLSLVFIGFSPSRNFRYPVCPGSACMSGERYPISPPHPICTITYECDEQPPLGHSSQIHANAWDRCTRGRVFRERVDRYRKLYN